MKMLLWRKCCCFDLRSGCIVTALFRILHWVVILSASAFTVIHVFSPDDKGLFHYRARMNIEQNAYVVFLMSFISLIGVIVEPVMMAGIIQLNPAYIRSWFIMTMFSFVMSLIVALTFILHNAHVIRIGDNWFNDALCVLADVVFFFVPEYLLGPRLIPLLIAILILAHLLLPLFHGFSFILVFSYYRLYVNPSQEAIAAARAGVTHSSAPPMLFEEELNGIKPHSRLCQKCHHMAALQENGGIETRCTSTPLLKPIETTC